MDWNFFSMAHGKGPVDDIGGAVKRAVWRRILQRRAIFNSAEEFAGVARECCPNIRILFVSKNEVEIVKDRLNDKWLQQPLKSISGTQALHRAVATSSTALRVQPVSPFSGILCDTKIVDIVDQTPCTSHDVSTENADQMNEIPPAIIAVAPDETNLKVHRDDYVVVKYDDQIFPGIVEEVSNGEYHVSVLHPRKGISRIVP